MFIDFRIQKSDVTSANDSKKWPTMKGKFFRGILRKLSVFWKKQFHNWISKKKKVKGLRSLKSLTFFLQIHEIQTQFALEMTRFFVVGFTTKRKQNHGSVNVNVFPNYPQRTPKQQMKRKL